MFRLASVVWQLIPYPGEGTKMLGPAVLTDDQRSNFDRDGYPIFDPGISVEILDRVILELQGNTRILTVARKVFFTTSAAFRTLGKLARA